MEICILGSSVTRDAFNYTKDLELGTYIARTGMLSITSKPLNVSIKKLNNESNFQKKMVYWDLNKLIQSKVTDLVGEYLIIDLIDERLRRIIIDKSIVTLSSELKKSGYLKDKKVEYVNFDIEEWKTACDKFYDIITKKFSEKNIILNKVYLSEVYIDNDGNKKEFSNEKLLYIKQFNKELEMMYSYFQSKFAEANVIYTEEVLANESHTWGLEPYHYEDKFYIQFIKKLTDIINQNKENEYRKYKSMDYSKIKPYLQSKNNIESNKISEILINNNTINSEKFEGFELINDDKIWIDESKYSRSYLRIINGFSYLLDTVYMFENTMNKNYINKSLDIIKRWFNENNFDERKDTMAFHDETTALRLENILMMIVKLRDYIDEEDLKYLLDKLDETAEILSRDSFHTTLTNHGMFQDIALLKYSIFLQRGNWKQYKRIAIERLRDYFDYVYTNEGIAKEHAPIYHLMITQNLIKCMRLIRLDEDNKDILGDIEQIMKNAETFIVDIMRLDGMLPNISDTEIQAMPDVYKKLFKSPEMKFVNSGGKEGRCPRYLDKVYKNSGYAIFRDGWSKNNAQVIFTAAYHSAYHKHTDDLNVLFYDEEDILVEAGPNGYNYKDPFTKYAYSARAHNTLSILNSPLPRTDGKFDKVRVLDYKICNEYSEVLGENDRYENVNHKRKVRFTKSNKILEVEDYITSTSENLYELNWNFAKGLNLKVDRNKAIIIKDNREIGLVKVFSDKPFELKVYNGFKGKSLKGWQFPKMESNEPISNLAVTCTANNAKFYTQIILYKNLKSDIIRKIYEEEEVYCSNENIKYIFEDDKDSKKLCIVFPAMSPKNKPAYNYIETLKDCKINKLFILDHFDVQGSYLIGKNRKFSIEDSVNSLIDKIISDKDILLKDIIMVGSSKGGYIALYNGLKRKVGNIIVGGPQSKLGNFLIDEAKHLEVAQYIAGSTNEESKQYLNNLLYDVIDNSNNTTTKIDIHVSKNDHHYKNHVIELAESIKEVSQNVELDLMDYEGHKKLKIHYPNFLLNKLNEIDNSIIDIKNIQNSTFSYIMDYDIAIENNNLYVKVNEANSKSKFAYYLFKDDTCIDKTKYSRDTGYKNFGLKPGKYRVRIFELLENNERKSIYTNWVSIPDNYYDELNIDDSVIVYSTQEIDILKDYKVYEGCYYISSHTSDVSIITKNNKYYYIDCSGTGIVYGKLVLNSNDIIPILEDKIDKLDLYSLGEHIRGSFCLTILDKTQRKSMILPDPLGSEIIYYYKNSDLTVFSSNIKSVVKILGKLGIKVNKSMDYINEVISTGRGGFFESSYEEIKSIKQFEFILHENNELKFEVYNCKETTFKNDKSYNQLLEMTKNEIIENINAISEYTNCQYRISHLTGGFDSRLVLAAILNSNKKDQYYFYCSGRTELPDRYIAECICSKFDLKMTEYSGLEKKSLSLSKSIEEELLESVEFTGGILSTQFTQRYEKSKNIILSGGYGEYLRTIYGNLVPNFKFDMDVYEIMRLLWGNNFYISDLENKSLLSKSFIDKLALKISKAIKNAKDLGIREDAILDYLFISTKYRYFGGVTSSVSSRCTARFDPLYSLSAIKCALNQSQDIRISNVIGFDLMKKFNDELPFYPFEGERYCHKFNEFRGEIEIKELEYQKPKFYLEDKVKVYDNKPLITISDENIKKAKRINGSAYQVAILPIVQKKCFNILNKINRKQLDKVFNRVVLLRLLRQDLNNRGQIRTLINLYSYLLWYTNEN